MSGRVLVVGGGIAGCTVALELRERGAEVLLLSGPEDPASRGAATGASAGMLAPGYEASEASSLYGLGVEARDRYPEFLARLASLGGGEVPRLATGMLVAWRSPQEGREAAGRATWQERAGQRSRLLEPREARRLEPALDPEALGCLWLPDAAVVDSQRLVRGLPSAVEGSGATVLRGRKARALLSERGRVTGIETGDGERLEGELCVLAAGAWSAGLEGLPRRLPVRPVKGEILRVRPPAGEAPERILAGFHGRYLAPRSDGSLLVGSTMEESGFDPAATPAGADRLREVLASLAPRLVASPTEAHWAGLRPVSSDGRPILGPEPLLEGLHYATGYGRNGILLSPRLAPVVADLALGRDPEAGWEALGVGRFTDSRPPDAGTSGAGAGPPRK